ncbi:MAG TPA: hypothetical protein VEL76_34685, partial [Gemmataceae bacterium]|nr:hypothetical protein [Gemmataceae bacterium]
MSKRFRLFQVALGLAAAVFFVMGLQAIQPNTPAGNTKGGGQPTLNPKQLAAKEKELADKYRQFQDLLLTLQQKLAASSDPKHKERAAQLAKALEQSDIRGIMVGF